MLFKKNDKRKKNIIEILQDTIRNLNDLDFAYLVLLVNIEKKRRKKG